VTKAAGQVRYNAGKPDSTRNYLVTTKSILDAALRLPARSRAHLVDKLLDSLEGPLWEEAILTGARIANRRLQGLRSGKTKGIPEREAHRLLFGKKKP
jgi:hypothetical protein